MTYIICLQQLVELSLVRHHHSST